MENLSKVAPAIDKHSKSSKPDNPNAIPSTISPPPPLPAPIDIGTQSILINPFYRPDPFGVQAVVPTGEEMREIDRKVTWHHKLKNYLRSEVSDLRDRTIHAFATGYRANGVIQADAVYHEEPGESEEDVGTRKARAVSRNWTREDLWTCYICLVVLISYYSFGSANSVLIITEAIHDFAMRGEVRFYQFELALSMLDVSKIIGIIVFAKLTNTKSRPFALLAAALVATGGVGLAAFAVTWESFSAGNALFHVGMSGALLVSQVIVADTSDLTWRGSYLWGLEMSSVIWLWTKPAVAKAIIGKVEWNVPVWIFFSLSIPIAIPSLVATYIFHRRAKHGGFFPASNHVYTHIWWSPRGIWRRFSLLSCELDLLGMFLWTLGLGLISTPLSVSEQMQTGIGVWIVGLLASGSLCIVLLALWELWLNQGLKTTHTPPQRQRPRRSPRVTWGALPGERVMIMGPAVPPGYSSFSVEQAAAELSVRIAESQDKRKLESWRKACNSYREKCYPLFRERMFTTHAIPVGCMIGFLAKFAMKISSWSLWDRPESLPISYRRIVESLQGGPALMNVEFTSFIVGGFFVGFLIRLTRTYKFFVLAGLFLMLCGLLIFQCTEVYVMQTFQIFVSQVIIGLGSGVVWISLLVGVQASCKTHSDVGMSIGLLTTSNALGEMTAGAIKRFMQAYMMNLLPPDTSQEYFLRALNGHWSVMIMVAIAATSLALVVAGIGLVGYNLGSVKQHVSGIVFGRDDAVRCNPLDEHASSLTFSPFVYTPEAQARTPSAPASSPSAAHLQGLRTAENYNSILLQKRARARGISPPPRPVSLSQDEESSKKDENSADARDQESPEWETAPSESAKTMSRVTSDSCMAASPTQAHGSDGDCVFTMDLDMELTPRATSPKELESLKDLGMNSSASQQVGTTELRGPNAMKRMICRARNSTEPPAKGSTDSITSQLSQLSFRKRQIGLIPSGPKNTIGPRRDSAPMTPVRKTSGQEKKMETDAANKSAWSDSTATSNKESSDGSSSEFEESVVINDSSVAPTPVEWEILDESNVDATNHALPSNPQTEFGNGQISPESHTVLMMSSDGEQELLQRWQSWVEDGDISDVPSGAHESEEEPTLPLSHRLPGVAQITSEVNALTVKNSYSPEPYLSTIEELSSQPSAASINLPVTGGSDSQLQVRTPLVIGVLSSSHHKAHGGEKEILSSDENTGTGSKDKKKKTKKRGKGKGKAGGRS